MPESASGGGGCVPGPEGGGVVSAPGRGGVGGWCACSGGVPGRGGLLPGGVSAPGGGVCLVRGGGGGYPSMH